MQGMSIARRTVPKPHTRCSMLPVRQTCKACRWNTARAAASRLLRCSGGVLFCSMPCHVAPVRVEPLRRDQLHRPTWVSDGCTGRAWHTSLPVYHHTRTGGRAAPVAGLGG